MNLQEEIAEFEAKGCVAGGRKWCPPYYMKPNKHTPILYIHYQNPSMQLTVVYCDELFSGRFSNYNFDLKSTTLEESLIEALEIVKAKVIELAKELGFVCFDKEQAEDLQEGLGGGVKKKQFLEVLDFITSSRFIDMEAHNYNALIELKFKIENGDLK